MQNDKSQAGLWASGAKNWAIQEATFKPLYEKIIDNIKLTQTSSILDVGCGTGVFLSLIKQSNCSITGIDISQNAIDIARQDLPGGVFEQGEMEHLPFADSTFDLVTGNNCFQFTNDPFKAMKEAFRVLKLKGKLIISLWGNPYECESFSYFRVFNSFANQQDDFSIPFNLSAPEKVESLLMEAGFEVQKRAKVVCARYYPDLQTALKGILSSGPAKLAINHSSYEDVSAKVAESISPFRQPAGSYKMDNAFFFIESSKA